MSKIQLQKIVSTNDNFQNSSLRVGTQSPIKSLGTYAFTDRNQLLITIFRLLRAAASIKKEDETNSDALGYGGLASYLANFAEVNPGTVHDFYAPENKKTGKYIIDFEDGTSKSMLEVLNDAKVQYLFYVHNLYVI